MACSSSWAHDATSAQLLQRAQAAGQRDEPVGQVGHLGLAFVERADDLQLGQAGVGQLAIDEPARDHADDLAARSQGRIGQGAHQPDPAAAVDDPDAALREARPDGPGQREVARRPPRAGAAEDTDPAHGQNPSSRRRGARRRAALARCEMACFSAGVHSPSVRPPGGSEAGSKIGS